MEKEHSPTRSKQELWEEKLKSLENTFDRIGKEMDPGVKEAVATFNLFGFPTSGSCEGHIRENGKAAFPYLQGAMPEEPSIRWIGEETYRREFMQEHNLTPKTFDALVLHYDDEGLAEKYEKGITTIWENGETPEYTAWQESNALLLKQIENLLEEWRASGGSSTGVHARLRPIFPGYRVEISPAFIDVKAPGSKEFASLSDSEKEKKLQECVLIAQEELRLFTEFLKKKFFSEPRG